jgi:hypothetical protein
METPTQYFPVVVTIVATWRPAPPKSGRGLNGEAAKAAEIPSEVPGGLAPRLVSASSVFKGLEIEARVKSEAEVAP